MKIAGAGKGGSGKTRLAGTLARILGRRGLPILAINADTNPNLALTLGIPREAARRIEPVPKEVMQDQLDASGQRTDALALSYREVMARHSVPAADNTRLLLMERVDHGGAG